MALAPPSSSSAFPTAFHLAATRPAAPPLCAAGFPLPRTRRCGGAAESRDLTAGCPSSAARAAEKWRLGVSFFPSFLSSKKGKSKEEIKEELLEAIAPLDRGAEATEGDRERIDQIARELEAVNSIKEPLKSNLLNGKWELIYTTSRSILATERPKIFRPNGKIYQAINADTLRAQNMETWPFFNQVTANLVPLNARRVAVKFDTFKILGLELTFGGHLEVGLNMLILGYPTRGCSVLLGVECFGQRFVSCQLSRLPGYAPRQYTYKSTW